MKPYYSDDLVTIYHGDAREVLPDLRAIAVDLLLSGSWLVWDKRDGVLRNTNADAELAWTNLGQPTRVYRHLWAGFLRDSEKGTSYHPTQKPVALMAQLIAEYSKPGGLVLDPYVGSGPVLVAAKTLGRSAIGIDIEERWCEMAANRCSQEVLGLSA